MHPRPLAIILCCALPLVAVATLAFTPSAGDGAASGAHQPPDAAERTPPASSAPVAQAATDAAPTVGTLSGLPARIADRALARAFAAVGLAEQGQPSALDQLDDQARERLDEARALLAAQPLVRRAGARGSPSAPSAEAQPSPALPQPGRASDGGAGAPERGLVLDLSRAVDPATALHNTPAGPVLVQPGLWAKASFDPSTQRQMVVSDASGSGYAITLFASDFSTVRLDGGLVVPGRFYLVNGSSVITGAVPCTVDIRPLSALGSYAPVPARPPQSNG